MKRVTKHQKGKAEKSGHVRLISGQYRGRKLPVPIAQGLRPSTDRTRETLFNWLMHDVRDSRCLDVFAGSGALGLEALSRYAKEVTFIELDPNVAAGLQKNLTTLNATGHVINGNAINAIARLAGQFDIVFIDPPFHQGLVAPALDALIANQKLASQALIYIEQERQQGTSGLPQGFTLLKEKTAGQLHYALWQAPTS